jgi:hypothetical protein
VAVVEAGVITVGHGATWAHAMFFRKADPNDTACRQNFDTFVGVLVWAF